MADTRHFDSPPVDWPDETEHRRKLAEAIDLLMEGKNRATGEVTLTANQATTTLNDRRIGPTSVIKFMATSANAKSEGEPWVSGRDDGTCTLNHTNNAQTDRSYDYAIQG